MTSQKILIVEDEQIVRLHLQSIVESLGHRVVGAASTSATARAAADTDPPDLVLMDIRLGNGGDGITTASELRRSHDCAVLFLTAHSDPETVRRAGEVDASGYVVKPFSSAEVAASITAALSSHRRLQRAERRERALSSAVGGDGDALVVVDRTGLVAFLNPKASRLTGWSVADACECSWDEVLHFEDAACTREVEDALTDAWTDGRARALPATELTCADGSSQRVELRVEPAQGGSGSGTGALLSLHPIEGELRRTPAAPQLMNRSFGAGTRLLVYSHDTLGLGHLRRSLNLVRALAERHPGLSTLLVTGSPMAHRYELPPGTDYLKLPAVRKTAPSMYSSRFLSMTDESIQDLRKNLLLRAVRDYDPDVLLVDHSPSGMNGELLPALRWLRGSGRCTTILGLRDVIDDPDHVVSAWHETGIYDLLRSSYDHLVVYGSQEVYDTVREYRLPPEVAAKATYVNFVTGPSKEQDVERDPDLVAVAIGGGDGGARTVVAPILEMLRAHGDNLGLRLEVVLGPFVDASDEVHLRDLAEGLPAQLHGFVPDPTLLFRRAGVVVSTAGYNVTTELLAHADRALLVPRVLHRQEQLIRARRLEALGLVRCLHPRHVDSARLLEEFNQLRNLPVGPLSEARAAGRVPLDGARRFAEFCAALTLDRAGAEVTDNAVRD